MESYQAVKAVRALKRGGVLVLRFTPIFQAYGLTVEKGLEVLEKMKAAMWESKAEEPSGGLMGGMTALYGDGEPPHPAIDLLLAEILFIANTRGAIAGIVDEAVSFMKNEGKTTLQQPWRDGMIEVFKSFHAQIQTEKNAMQELKTTLRGVGLGSGEVPEPSEENEEGEE